MIDIRPKLILLFLCLMMSESARILQDADHYEYNQWMMGDSLSPRSTDASAVAYDTESDTILLLGGYFYPNQLVSFNNGSFTDHGQNNLSLNIYGSCQYYTQIGNILYLTYGEGTQIVTFNIDTLQFESRFAVTGLWGVHFPSYVCGCLSSVVYGNNAYLFLLPGSLLDYHPSSLSYSHYLQIYNITSQKWLDNTPNLQIRRARMSCNINNGKFYVIGGRNDWRKEGIQSAVEVLDITDNLINIANQSWEIMDNLTAGCDRSRSITYNDDIIIVGCEDESGPSDTVHIIDSLTNSVSIGGFLNHSLYTAATIMMNQIIYIFGGDTAHGWPYRSWQYMDLTASYYTDSLKETDLLSDSLKETDLLSDSLKETDLLSDGEIIGISIAVVFLLIVLLILLWIWWDKKKSNKSIKCDNVSVKDDEQKSEQQDILPIEVGAPSVPIKDE